MRHDGETVMAVIVLVHGIAQEQRGATSLEADWIPAVRDGISAAGYPEVSDHVSDGDIRMAFYGDLFLKDGAQGEEDTLSDMDAEQQELAATLAAEWLKRAATRNDHPDNATAQQKLAALNKDSTAMGAREEAARIVLNGIASLAWFAPFGMGIAERFVNKSLRQVTRYLTEPPLQADIQKRVLQLIGPETKIVIGHSLGSVVAYEVAASHLMQPLPLLLTIGSPLGLRTIIYDRVQPQPPIYPPLVRRWVNISDRNDLVAAVPDLTDAFGRDKPSDATLESTWTVDNGAEPHMGEYYLTKKEAGRPIAQVLRSGQGKTAS